MVDCENCVSGNLWHTRLMEAFSTQRSYKINSGFSLSIGLRVTPPAEIDRNAVRFLRLLTQALRRFLTGDGPRFCTSID